MNQDISYICTTCGHLLKKHNDCLTCEKCEKQWPIIDGIPQFTEEHHYWGEISQDLMQQINKQIQKENWKDVLKRTLGEHNQEETYDFVTDLKRANWHLFLPLPSNAHVLDIGCGLGTISHSLSRHYEKIVSIETVPERLFFSKIRFQQENIQNVELVRANLLDLPFPENSFDLVVMNGVLEWVGLSEQSKNPRDLQLLALRNIHRVLKNTGTLYIGIENRIGYSYFLGRVDHSYLKYSSLLPRRLANLYTRRKKNEDYRTYTYSYSGYQKLLKQAGFQDTNFYCPFPGYNKQNLIFELKKNAVNYYIKQFIVSKYFKKRVIYFLTKALSNLGLFKYVVGDYIIFTQKSDPIPDNKIINYIKNNWTKLNLNKKHLKDISLLGHNYASGISFLLLHKNQSLFHIKLSSRTDNENTLKQEYENLKIIKNQISVQLKNSIINFLLFDEFDGFQILIQNTLPGIRLDELFNACKHPHKEKEQKIWFHKLDLVKTFLIKFHRSVQNGYFNFTPDELELKITKPFKQFFDNNNGKTLTNEMENIFRQARNLNDLSIPKIPQHGDFCACNILMDKEHVQVIDWENYTLTYLPLFDLFHILTTSLMPFLRVKEISTQTIFKRSYFEQSELTNFIRYFIGNYCEQLNIAKEFIKLCFPLYLITFHNMFSSNPAKQEIVENYRQYLDIYFEHSDKIIFS